MSRALVTGASGFVGSNLARHLGKQGWDVRCLVRPTSKTGPLESLGVELVRGSLHNHDDLTAAIEGADVVFHLAGRTVAHRPVDFMHDNVEGTRSVAAACAAQPHPPVMVFVSSLAAGGPGTFAAPRREADPPAPVSAYGRSKLAAEEAAIAAAPNVPLSIMRPPMVFGQADRASWQLFRQLRYFPIHMSPGLRRFPVSVVHVSDLCDALLRVAERGVRVPAGEASKRLPGAGRYYVAADRAITYSEFGRLAARAAGWKVAPIPSPKTFFWVAGSLGVVVGRLRRRPSIINWDKVRETMAKGWICSDEKIRTTLGYAPAASLEERFAETVAWYRAHAWL
jgi:nucleoside-diphosphate-sugar epimerase